MSREWIFMNGSRFWDGNTWVNEFPDAAKYSVTNGNQLMPTAKRIKATAIVAGYGTNVEKRISVPWTAVILPEDDKVTLTVEVTHEELHQLRMLISCAQDEHIKENGAQLHPILKSLSEKFR